MSYVIAGEPCSYLWLIHYVTETYGKVCYDETRNDKGRFD